MSKTFKDRRGALENFWPCTTGSVAIVQGFFIVKRSHLSSFALYNRTTIICPMVRQKDRRGALESFWPCTTGTVAFAQDFLVIVKISHLSSFALYDRTTIGCPMVRQKDGRGVLESFWPCTTGIVAVVQGFLSKSKPSNLTGLSNVATNASRSASPEIVFFYYYQSDLAINYTDIIRIGQQGIFQTEKQNAGTLLS